MISNKENNSRIYQKIKEGFSEIVKENKLSTEEIRIYTRGLSSEEAIGNTKRKDFPLLTGKEVLLQAEYKGAAGQAFTDSPSIFSGTLNDILELDIENDIRDRGLFIASLNAVTRYLSMSEGTIHCCDDGPELCAKEAADIIESEYGSPKISLIGYQPSFIEAFSKKFRLRVLDMNPENIGKTKYGINIEHGEDDYDDVVLNWADLVFCTGSVFANGTAANFIDIDKEVVFFGTTIAGAAEILGLKRLCCRST